MHIEPYTKLDVIQQAVELVSQFITNGVQSIKRTYTLSLFVVSYRYPSGNRVEAFWSSCSLTWCSWFLRCRHQGMQEERWCPKRVIGGEYSRLTFTGEKLTTRCSSISYRFPYDHVCSVVVSWRVKESVCSFYSFLPVVFRVESAYSFQLSVTGEGIECSNR